jgi:hypothetical protein
MALAAAGVVVVVASQATPRAPGTHARAADLRGQT